MNMCIYDYVYVCMYLYDCTYMNMFMYICMYVCVCMYICMYVRMHTRDTLPNGIVRVSVPQTKRPVCYDEAMRTA
jgi:hypothetical protein